MKLKGLIISCICLLAAFSAAQRAVIPTASIGRVAEIWKFADARMSRQADRWFDKGDFPRVVQLLKVRHMINTKNYERVTDLGWMLRNLERHDEELALYVAYRMSAVEKDPDAAFPEANWYFERKLYAKVPPLLEPTLKQNPHPNSFRLLALSYERQGMLESAKKTWQTYIQGHPNDEQAKRNLERVVKKMSGK